MKVAIFVATILMLTGIISSQSITLTLPVPQQTMTKVTLSLQKLEQALKYFGTFLQNKWFISKRVELTKLYLHQLGTALDQYNNFIVGTANNVTGNKNIVIGNYDNIEGSNNWVFVSSYTGQTQINGDLLIGQWRVELDKSYLIPINTRFAISLLSDDRNKDFRNKFASKNRKFCNWDNWTHPQNIKSDSHWKKYSGYSQWKTNTLEQIGNTWGSWAHTFLGPFNNFWGLRW